MRLGLTTEGAETPVRAARKEACERIRFAQLGRNSPTLDGRQMICGRGVDEWHEVRLPPSSFRAPRSGFPRFQWLTDLSTAPPVSSAPLRQTRASTTRPSRHKWTLHFLFTPRNRGRGIKTLQKLASKIDTDRMKPPMPRQVLQLPQKCKVHLCREGRVVDAPVWRSGALDTGGGRQIRQPLKTRKPASRGTEG